MKVFFILAIVLTLTFAIPNKRSDEDDDDDEYGIDDNDDDDQDDDDNNNNDDDDNDDDDHDDDDNNNNDDDNNDDFNEIDGDYDFGRSLKDRKKRYAPLCLPQSLKRYKGCRTGKCNQDVHCPGQCAISNELHGKKCAKTTCCCEMCKKG